MKWLGRHIYPLLSHPLFLAIPLSIALILFGGLVIGPYRLSVLDQGLSEGEGAVQFYQDLNADGEAEHFRAYQMGPSATLVVRTNHGEMYETWNFPERWIYGPDLLVFDRDKDGVSEAYALTANSGDSLLISRQVLSQDPVPMQTRFVARLGRYNSEYDHDLGFLGHKDLTGDGMDEILFTVNAGFTLQPRGIFAWDLQTDRILRTPASGINYKMTRELITRDDPSSDRLGLFAVTAATDNDRGSFACSDSGSYGVVLDAGLQFRFPPIPLGGPQSASHAFPFQVRDTSGVLVLTFHNRRPDNKIALNFFSLGGEKLREQRSDLFTGTPRIRLIQEDILLTGPSGRDLVIARVEPDLTLREEHRFKERHVGVIPANLDGDEPTEFLVTNAMDQEISILQDKFSKPVRVRIPGNIPAGPLVTIRQRNEQETQVYLHGDGGFLLLGYAKNPLHPFRFAIYTFYYLLIFGFLSLLQRILSYNNRMKSKREKELLDYQLQSVMNQLSPHYTFNALNAIGDAVREGRSEEAYEYFTTLAGLIRRSMTHATQPYSTLGEELGFVTEYLEIEDYRFRDKLTWHLHLDPEINLEIPVPKMLIHIFVENALKHGIFHLKEKGRIELDLRRDNRAITITIRDNGVGFAEARRLEGRVGDGLRIFDNYLEIYNTQNLHRITYTISDLQEKGKSGTRVEIRVRDPER